MTTLRAGDDGEAFLGRDLRGGDDGADTGGIDRDGLLDENMFIGCDRGREMARAETGRSREDHVVHIGREELLVGVESPERFIRRNFETVAGLHGLTFEEIGHRHDFDAGRGIEGVFRRIAAATTTTDDADADGVGAGDRAERPRRADGRESGGASGEGGEPHEIAAGQIGCFWGIHRDKSIDQKTAAG